MEKWSSDSSNCILKLDSCCEWSSVIVLIDKIGLFFKNKINALNKKKVQFVSMKSNENIIQNIKVMGLGHKRKYLYCLLIQSSSNAVL